VEERLPDAPVSLEKDLDEPPPPPRKSPAKAAKKAPAKAAKKAAPRKAPARKAVAPAPAALHESDVTTPDVTLAALLGAPSEPAPPPLPPPAPLPVAPAPQRRSRAGGIVFAALSLILALAAGFAAAAWNESKPHVYQSSAALLIDQGAALTFARDEGLVTKLGALRYKYADQVTTTTFAGVVAGKTGMRPGLVHSALSAQVPLRSLLLNVTARSTDQSQPQRIAQAAAQQLSQDLDNEQRVAGVAPKARVTLTLVSPAQPAVHISPSRRRSQQLAAGAFGAVLLGAALLRDLTRRRSGPAVA
jgi:hypothetical protein